MALMQHNHGLGIGERGWDAVGIDLCRCGCPGVEGLPLVLMFFVRLDLALGI
jgi:hypothetical protein